MKTISALIVASLTVVAQNPGSMVVTAEGGHDKAAPPVTAADVMVYQKDQRRQVLDWTPLKGDRGALEFYLLIDDGAGTDFGTHLDELRKFVRSLPAEAEVGVGYLRNGTVSISGKPTRDHDQAAKAIRLPIGTPDASGSPYVCVSDFVKHWPATSARREALLITNGLDPYFDEPTLDDPYLNTAIADAQRAGVILYSIYFPGGGHFGHTYWRSTWGENYLSQLSDKTGGENWWQGFGNPVSFTPYLDELRTLLDQQYLLTFQVEGKPGLQPVRLRTELPHVSLMHASKVEAK